MLVLSCARVTPWRSAQVEERWDASLKAICPRFCVTSYAGVLPWTLQLEKQPPLLSMDEEYHLNPINPQARQHTGNIVDFSLHHEPRTLEESYAWPQGCRFFDKLVMNAGQITTLLDEDTRFAPEHFAWDVRYCYISNDSVVKHRAALTDDHYNGIFSDHMLKSHMSVVYIRQKRLYLQNDSLSAVSVDRAMWTRILQYFEVLPSFLELLHSNNGGSLAFTTYSSPTGGSWTPIAFHVGYKIGDWGSKYFGELASF
jgi:hypothetical protein